MNRTKEELLKRREVSPDELEGRMLSNLDMVIGYLKHLQSNWKCKRGEHRWMDCEPTSGGYQTANVAEMGILGNDMFSCRACWDCGTEMPDSRSYFKKSPTEHGVNSCHSILAKEKKIV